MDEFFLRFYGNAGYIIGIMSILVSILLSGFATRQNTDGQNTNQKIKLSIPCGVVVLCSLLVLATVFVAIISENIAKKKTVVPNIYGMTYDDAITALSDNGLMGRLLLASTNENLSATDSRVVWQSESAGSTTERDTVISFVIDDSFALEYIPLNQRNYQSLSYDQSANLEYTCDYRDAIKQSLEIEREAEREGTPVVYEFEESHWYIEIEPPETKYNITTGTSKGRNFTMADNSYSYHVYSNAMCGTLQEIAEATARTIGGSPFEDYFIVGKLISIDEEKTTNLKETQLSDEAGVLFLPLVLTGGNYKFVMSFLDESGDCYEWYHDIKILESQ